MAKKRHWYTRRTAKDAPSSMADQAHDNFSSWAQGYNDCVEAYLREVAEVLEAEGFRVEERY